MVRAFYWRFGAWSIYVPIVLPTLVFCTLALSFHLPLLLGVVAGVRGCLFDFQHSSKELEIALLGTLKAAPARPPST